MMDIQQDIKTLKDQGVSDEAVSDLLLLKGRSKRQIEDNLKVYYQNLHSTEVIQKTSSQNPILLIALTIILLVIAIALGWYIITR